MVFGCEPVLIEAECTAVVTETCSNSAARSNVWILAEKLSGCMCIRVKHAAYPAYVTAAATRCLKHASGSAGSQLPLAKPRSDARQNLIDAITCATSYFSPPHVSSSSENSRILRISKQHLPI